MAIGSGRWLTAGAVLGMQFALTAPLLAQAATAPATVAATEVVDPAKVAELVAAVKAAIAGAPATATQEDLESVIVFAADQVNATCPVTVAALRQVSAETNVPKVRRALQNVLKGRCPGEGTGATGSPSSLGGGPTAGSGGGGSGGTDYGNGTSGNSTSGNR